MERVFARVAQLRPDCELVVVSPDNWRPRRVASIRVHRGITDAELSGLYREAACVLSTARQEGFGMAVSEALYFGTPVVATQHPATDELLSNAPLSVAVEASVNELAAAVCARIEKPESDRAAARWAHDFLSPRAAAERIGMILRDVTSSAPR